MEKAQAIRKSLLADGVADPKVERDYAMGHYNLALLAALAGSVRRRRAVISEGRRADSTPCADEIRPTWHCRTSWLLPSVNTGIFSLHVSARRGHRPLRELARHHGESGRKEPQRHRISNRFGRDRSVDWRAEYQLGHLDVARTAFESAQAILMTLLADHASDQRCRHNYIAATGAVAKLHREAGRRAEAEKVYEALAQQLRQILERNPDLPGVNEELKMPQSALDELRASPVEDPNPNQ